MTLNLPQVKFTLLAMMCRRISQKLVDWLDTVLNMMLSSTCWQSLSTSGSMPSLKVSPLAREVQWLKKQFVNLTWKTKNTSRPEHSVVEIRGSFLLQLLFLEIHLSSYLMSHQLVWTPRLADSCGQLSRRFLNNKRKVPSSSQLTRWRKPKPFRPRWASWFVEASSDAWEALNMSRTSTEWATKLRSRLPSQSTRICNSSQRCMALKRISRARSNFMWRLQDCARQQSTLWFWTRLFIKD